MTSPLQEYEYQPLVSLEEALKPLQSIVHDLEEMFQMIQLIDRQRYDSLSFDESASIMLYTLKWKTSQTSFQYLLNQTLRSQNRVQIQPWLLYLRLFIQALSKLSSNSFLTVYRTLTMNDIPNEYNKDEDFIWWDFVSCTSSLQLPDEHRNDEKFIVIFIIECDFAKDISQYSSNRNINEILLYPGRKFRVISSIDYGNQSKLIQVKEIRQRQPSFHIPQVTFNRNFFMPSLESTINQYPRHSKIDLNDLSLSETDMHTIVKYAIINKQCSKLLLSRTQITPAHISILVNGLTANMTLKFLSLSYNVLSDHSIQSLMKILAQNNCKIETLSLHKTGITDQCVVDLANMLKTNTTLTWLHLGRNKISDQSISLLTDVLIHYNQTLKALDLSHNKLITNSSGDAIAEILENSLSLETLWINGCQLSDDEKKRLQKIVQDNRRFFLLFVGYMSTKAIVD